jgi:two-component system, NarL family, nitrate/nitrite response regulator NarL
MKPNASPNPIRILLVDDHRSFADGLSMLINANRSLMQVVGAAAGRNEALDAAAAAKPDVILLDVDLGDENGLDILPELAEKSRAKIVILTGIADPAVHERAVLAGAKGVLLKTDSAQVILKAIEKVHLGEIWLSNETLNKVLGKLTRRKSFAGESAADPEERKIASLTARERAIIRALVNKEFSTNKEIAESLFISDSTLKNHLTTVYAKLGVRNRIELLKYALTHGLDKSPNQK